MPGLNRKGPMGEGPLTGRRMGRCTNFGASLKKQAGATGEEQNKNLPEDNPDRGFGFGGGRGFGRGRGFGFGRCGGFGGGRGFGRGGGFGYGQGRGREQQDD